MIQHKHIKFTVQSILLIVGLFILFYTLDQQSNWFEVGIFWRTGNPLKGIIYFLTYWAITISIFIGLFHKNKFVYIFTLFLSFITITIELMYQRLNGHGMGYEDGLLLIQNIGFELEGEAFNTFFPELINPLIIASISILGIIGFRLFFKKIRINKRRYLLIPILVFIATNYIVYLSNANRLDYPIPYKIPLLLSYVQQKGIYSGDRDSLYLSAPKTSALAKHIIWIVDESVRADVFQINHFDQATTPFLYSIKDSILNYGIASSGAVCSDYSHIMLMSGLKRNQLPDEMGASRKQPTIFQYAELAGMQSNLLYVPGHEPVPKGYMTLNDFELIDHKFHTKKIYPDAKTYELDHLSIDILDEIISKQESSFTYFLKYGCHFHYESTYPEQERVFAPVEDINDWNREDREALLNSYYNSIRWSVDHFLKELYERYQGQDVLIFYTSDHGQQLMEYPDIKLTHCVKHEAPSEMAQVPLFLMPLNNRIYQSLNSLYLPENRDLASHFNIFPTTLQLMGFDSLAIQNRYEPSLFVELDSTNQNFISGDIFGRSQMYFNAFHKK